ncbi:hypothetical protein JT358_11230 [Micrococcales bacterium 31B]|nr:hypothetical protein [Micrococcales bacterium 31B]
MKKTTQLFALSFVVAGLAAPSVAFAQSHWASITGVTARSSGSTITVTKTEDNNMGVFGHYVAGGVDRVTGVTAVYHNSISATAPYDITAINACLSNGPFPATCSAWNNVY